MTDDFQLFPDASGEDAIDADIALITAYLARELSPVQIVAVEDRLATDKAFRDKVRPILGAWAMPAPLPAVHPGERPLSRDEVQAGWQRYVGEHAEVAAHDGPQLVVGAEQPKRRKISMTRIAAGIAAITLPIVTLAQVAVYVSHHPSVPGHSVAKQMVAPFVEAPPAAPPPTPEKPLTSPVDVPVGRQLQKGTTEVQRATDVQVPAAETPKPQAAAPAAVFPMIQGVTPSTLPPKTNPSPDRAKIAALANKHMPQLIRGDTAATYIVMVLDAADNYVWGTFGSGTVELAVAGDKRWPSERSAFSRANSLEYTGRAPVAGGGGRGGGVGTAPAFVVGGVGVGGGGGAAGGGRARGGGGAGDSLRRTRGDTISVFQLDSATQRLYAAVRGRSGDTTFNFVARGSVADSGRGARGGGGGGGGGVARGGGAADARLGTIMPIIGLQDSAGVYRIGASTRAMPGQVMGYNQAAGLQEPNSGESGIQGLKATSLTMGESYLFSPGQLLATPIRIIVVHLAPGTSWTGR